MLPSPGVLFDLNLPAHGVHQLGADGEPQPGATVASGGGAIGLGKGLEDQFLLVFGNADAGVVYLKVQC